MTKIPWVRNPDGTPGYTWNPITGCLNGCPYCYARKLANTRLKERYLHGFPDFGIIADRDYQGGLDDPFYPRIWPTKISIPIHRRKPTGYFVCDMSDLFGIGVPEQWTSAVLETIRKCPQHRFYLLTKQPQELAKFSPFPPNCFVMVSATDAKMLIRGGEYLS